MDSCLQVVLNNATVETDNPDLRDRAYIYWRLLSTDPEVCIYLNHLFILFDISYHSLCHILVVGLCWS